MPILLQAQGKKLCDSSIAVCPDVFDHLIKQDILEQKYYTDYYHVLTEKNILVFQLQQTDSLQKATSDILRTTNEEKVNDRQQYDIVKNDNKTLKKKNTGLKIVTWVEAVLGAIGIGLLLGK